MGNEAECGHASAVVSGFSSLGDDDVGAVLDGGLPHRRDLLHHEAARGVGPFHQVGGVIEREGHDRRRELEGELEPGRIEIGHDVVQRERPVGGVSELVDLAA